jgi:hypothetical protein
VRRPSNLLILAVAFLVAIAGTFVFGYRAGRYAHRLRLENEPIRSWMSLPLIGLEPVPHDRRPLRAIARAEHRPVSDLIRDLDKALESTGHMHPALRPPPAGKGS